MGLGIVGAQLEGGAEVGDGFFMAPGAEALVAAAQPGFCSVYWSARRYFLALKSCNMIESMSFLTKSDS